MSMENKTIRILKTDINQVTYDDALVLFRRWMADDLPVRTVVAANVHLVTEAALNTEYAETISDADLVTADEKAAIRLQTRVDADGRVDIH